MIHRCRQTSGRVAALWRKGEADALRAACFRALTGVEWRQRADYELLPLFGFDRKRDLRQGSHLEQFDDCKLRTIRKEAQQLRTDDA